MSSVTTLKLELKSTLRKDITDLKILLDEKVLRDELKAETQTLNIETTNFRVGHLKLKMTYTDAEGKEHADTRKLIFFSDVTPEEKNNCD